MMDERIEFCQGNHGSIGKRGIQMAEKIENEISNIVSELMNDYRKQRITDKTDMANQPQKKYVVALLEKIIKLIFAGYFRDQGYKVYNLEHDY